MQQLALQNLLQPKMMTKYKVKTFLVYPTNGQRDEDGTIMLDT